MPFDAPYFSFSQNDLGEQNYRIYVCDCGHIRIETRHFRQSFTPEEFVCFLREKLLEKQKTISTGQHRLHEH